MRRASGYTIHPNLMNQLLPILLAFSHLLLASCGDGTLGYVSEQELTGEYPLPAGTHTLVVRLPSGSLSIICGEQGKVTIKEGRSRLAADLAEDFEVLKQLDFTLRPQAGGEPGVLHLGTASLPASLKPEKTAMIMRVLLEVPAEISVDLETGRGPVSVVDRHGDVRVHTGSGDLRFSGNHGHLRAFTGMGGCLVENHRGGLELETMHGTILAYVDEVGPGGLQLRTHGGSVQCRVPMDAAFDLEMFTKIGECKSSFGLPVEALEQGMKIRGAVRGGGPDAYLWSARGDLSIVSKQ